MTPTPPPSSQRGFTLVELMMALVIFSVAVAGILSVAVSMTNGFREQRQALAAQDSVRAPLDMIADALRQASPGISSPANVYDATNCSSGAITVTDNTAAPDALDIIYASGGIVTSIAAVGSAITTSGGTMTVAHTTNLADGDYVLLTSDFTTGHVMRVTTGTSGTTVVLAASSCGTAAPWNYSYNVNTAVIRVQHATFTVANDSFNTPTLWMDADSTGTVYAPEPLAEGIEDMQIALGADVVQVSAGTPDGVTETYSATAGGDDWVHNVAGETLGSNAIRAVRITLIARTTAEQQGNQSTYLRPAAENRAAASVYDRYRRRVLKTVVEVRNVTGSP